MEVYSMDCNIIKCTCIFRGCVCVCVKLQILWHVPRVIRDHLQHQITTRILLCHIAHVNVLHSFSSVCTFRCRCTFIHARKDRKRKQRHIFSILGNSKWWKEHTLGLLNKFLLLFLEKSIKAERRRWKTVWIANRQLKNWQIQLRNKKATKTTPKAKTRQQNHQKEKLKLLNLSPSFWSKDRQGDIDD